VRARKRMRAAISFFALATYTPRRLCEDDRCKEQCNCSSAERPPRHIQIVHYKVPPASRAGTKGRPQSGGNPGTLALFRAAAHSRFLEEVGLDQGAQFRCHLRLNSEPELKTAHRLLQQHAKSIGGPHATWVYWRQQCRYQQRLDNVGYHHR